MLFSCEQSSDYVKLAEDTLNGQILENAEWAMSQMPQTVIDFHSEKSSGGIHDYYSEGDYWWPDTEKPDGAYIKRDGEINPDNFMEHRMVMIRFSKIIGSLASAYIQTNNEEYVKHAFLHINAWFADTTTVMNPNLQYAQAIKGITSGRSVGIIDTIHLMEVAQGIYKMQNAGCVDKENLRIVKKWFEDYLRWLTTSSNGINAMNVRGNHATFWVMQVAAFARLTDNDDLLKFCKLRYKNVLLPDQMAEDGSFPLELAKINPYSHSLTNLDAMAAICQILSDDKENLWEYSTYTGLNIKKGIEYMYPFIKDKENWTLPKDMAFWENWPVAQPALLFGAYAYKENSYFNLWKNLEHKAKIAEVERNLPIRNPLIWM
ncbi:alginate lyase family protein [Dysgonomonas sp. OttesenSCG-928-D17]|nr:alginate lyase family protein [Dysgonomonas sp. OttesenSCG-928-D17]